MAEDLKFKEIIEELNKEILDKDLIQDNKFHFTENEVLYRVRMPNQHENTLAKEIFHSAKVELLNKPNTIFEKQLKKN